MYHISKDSRSRQSAELIYQGLMKCLKKKSFDEITISDIQKASSVARTTFYRCFDNLSDVLYWKCDLCFHEVLVDQTRSIIWNEMDYVREYFTYWIEHSEILDILIKINRLDIIFACHMKNAEILHKAYGDIPGLTKEHGNYYMAIRTGFTISILTAWIRNGRNETPDELISIIEEQIALLAKQAI